MIPEMITGSIVALVTPMRSDGAVDHEALAKAVDRAVNRHLATTVEEALVRVLDRRGGGGGTDDVDRSGGPSTRANGR